MTRYLTVKDLRAYLASLPADTSDDLPVVIEVVSSEYDHTDASDVSVCVLDWMTDEDGEELEETEPRRCLVVS